MNQDRKELIKEANDPSTRPDRLKELAGISDVTIQLAVLRNPNCPPSVYYTLQAKLGKATALIGYQTYQ